ncbi:YdcF family protein [Kocuria marina]|uniref:YdcF family protein n=1 Tax=Kocuria marina TaxID=223184 RepID=UPI0021B3FF91|nr:MULTISPECIES: YdcF family protein [Kocuria]MCT1722810.1 YdcF family protein [Kocuria marina]MCT1733814.1 YdcF family protein [Kocuria marina]
MAHAAPGQTLAKKRRWPLLVLTVLTILVVLWLAVCHAVLDNPRVDPPKRSDAVFVLGPPDTSRMAYAEDLVFNQHVADTLVISAPDPQPYEPPQMQEYYSTRPFCAPREGVEVICFKPDPSTTQGEAMELQKLFEERGWDTVTAVTFTQHVPRSRLILSRCYPGELRMSAVDFHITGKSLLMQYLHQTGGFLKAWLTPGCDQQLPWNPKSLD